MSSSGWAVELTGEPFDIDDLRRVLRFPFDPWIEDIASGGEPNPHMRHSGWAQFTSVSDVVADAQRIVSHINGAARLLHSDYRPVGVSNVVRFHADGRREFILPAVTGHFNVTLGRVRFRAEGTVGEGGFENGDQPSILQDWLSVSGKSDLVSDLFIHLDRSDNWFDVYKTMEIMEKIVGDGRRLKRVPSLDGQEWKRVRQAANHFRHAPGVCAAPNNPPSLEASVAFIRACALLVLGGNAWDRFEVANQK
ncbi:hypothetical protein [Xanthobacter aminoxidans]|uniref:hypothetical protein n=1 Tax=Xanthobacter aminoxidans TaxID=186280 RepID=UPI002022F574|nr:hypothetical protein [Xanthobacter aminoxidans]MCL8380890.1 hypothetical protein [Xanthobacter aminoxidans]